MLGFTSVSRRVGQGVGMSRMEPYTNGHENHHIHKKTEEKKEVLNAKMLYDPRDETHSVFFFLYKTIVTPPG